MAVTSTEIKGAAERLKRRARDIEVLGLCDLVLGWVPERVEVEAGECPSCEKRRAAQRGKMQRWRVRKRDAPPPG